MTDGQVFLRYRVEELGFTRTAALSGLEAATLRYAMHRANGAALSHEDRVKVEDALRRLNESLGITDLAHAGPGAKPRNGDAPAPA